MSGTRKSFNLADHVDLFHLLFDSNYIGITVVQPDGTIIYYNDAQSQLDSLPREKALGHTICDVYRFTPEDSPTMQAISTGKIISDRVHFYRTRHGKLVNSTCDVYPLFKDGVLVGALCCIHGYSIMDKHLFSIVDVDEPLALSSPEKQASKRKSGYRFKSLIGQNAALTDAMNRAKQAARNFSPVMLIGETGVGKEIFAQSIHYGSPRSKHPYTAINCSAMPESLLEGILFGTTRGAFTGAIDKDGLFEVTHKGTLFLDELDSMPITLQSKLLRVLQEKQVRRIGDSRERELDVRIISSVSRNPLDLVNEGVLRPDFYYRLGVVKVSIPPLRERLDDLHLLAQHFIKKHSDALGIKPPLITPEAMGILYNHSWPGNVRELEHAIEASLNLLEDNASIKPENLLKACPDIFSEGEILPSKTTPWLAYQSYIVSQDSREAASEPERNGMRKLAGSAALLNATGIETGRARDVEFHSSAEPHSGQGLLRKKHLMEKETICNALQQSAGNMALAARLMQISPQLMQYKVKKYRINVKEYVPNSL